MPNRILLVIDVQNEYFSGKLPVTFPVDSLNRIVDAMIIAKEKNIPIALIQHTAPQKDSKTFVRGSKNWEIHQDVIKQKYDYIIEKQLPGSFTNTDL